MNKNGMISYNEITFDESLIRHLMVSCNVISQQNIDIIFSLSPMLIPAYNREILTHGHDPTIYIA